MNRKVVQQGPSTLMISLPTKWVKEHTIQKGDDIDVSEEHDRLVLTLHKQSDPSRKEIFEDTFGVLNKYFLNYCYQKGYDEVLIKGNSLEEIEQRVKELIGFEIVEKTEKSILIKAVAQANEQEFDTLLKKLFQVTLTMGELIREKKFAEAIEKEKETNTYSDLCIRILFKTRYTYPDNGFVLFALLRELEQIADVYKLIAQDLDDSLLNIFSSVHDYFRLYYQLYYAYDPSTAQKFFSEKQMLIQELNHREKTIATVHLTTLVHAVFNLKGLLYLQKV